MMRQSINNTSLPNGVHFLVLRRTNTSSIDQRDNNGALTQLPASFHVPHRTATSRRAEEYLLHPTKGVFLFFLERTGLFLNPEPDLHLRGKGSTTLTPDTACFLFFFERTKA